MFLNNSYDIGIRAIEEQDLEWLKEQRNHPSTWTQLTSITMLNSHRQKEWWLSLNKDPSREYLIAFLPSNNEPVGLVRFDEIDHQNQSIRIGADIHPAKREQGLGTKLYMLLLDYCFNYLNMNRVWLLTLDSNFVAKKLYNKLGFQEEGRAREAIYRSGQWHDYVIMSILRKEYNS